MKLTPETVALLHAGDIPSLPRTETDQTPWWAKVERIITDWKVYKHFESGGARRAKKAWYYVMKMLVADKPNPAIGARRIGADGIAAKLTVQSFLQSMQDAGLAPRPPSEPATRSRVDLVEEKWRLFYSLVCTQSSSCLY